VSEGPHLREFGQKRPCERKTDARNAAEENLILSSGRTRLDDSLAVPLGALSWKNV
jgi:hypothetical protein